MTRTEIAAELRRISGGGLITAREVGVFIRDSNPSRVREKCLKGLEAYDGKYYLVTDVAARIKERSKS